mmetsp:Transcript_6459/g.23694  ORF Transcript_6459/g.23694 Transcript_6459/m.23694 type:complete len:236 (+) Transcript_6459:649-1356(+)
MPGLIAVLVLAPFPAAVSDAKLPRPARGALRTVRDLAPFPAAVRDTKPAAGVALAAALSLAPFPPAVRSAVFAPRQRVLRAPVAPAVPVDVAPVVAAPPPRARQLVASVLLAPRRALVVHPAYAPGRHLAIAPFFRARRPPAVGFALPAADVLGEARGDGAQRFFIHPRVHGAQPANLSLAVAPLLRARQPAAVGDALVPAARGAVRAPFFSAPTSAAVGDALSAAARAGGAAIL